MASPDAIALIKEQATRDLNEVIEMVGGREAVERVNAAGMEGIQPDYNEARRLQEMANVFHSFIDSGKIKEETGLEALEGIGEDTASRLRDAGYTTKGELREASNEDLMKISGIGGSTVRQIRKQL